MNIVIDKDSMAVLCKMEHHGSLAKLCDLQYPHLATSILYCDRPIDLHELTDLELKTLIKCAAGPDVGGIFHRDTLLRVAFEIVTSLPETKVNAFEVDLVWRQIGEKDTQRYIYKPGSNGLHVAPETLECAALQCPPNAVGRAVALAKAPVQGPVHSSGASAPALRPAVEAAGDFVQPRPGTSTHTIFNFCATAWKDAGYPDDDKSLDKIKKFAVTKLVPTGLNVSTVRTQATRWYHNRKRFVI